MDGDDFIEFNVLLQRFQQITNRLLKYAKEGEERKCYLESQNRERLVKIMIKSYGQNSTMAKLFKEKIDRIVQKDAKVLELLANEKDHLERDISTLTKFRKTIQGYNLNKLRK